MRGGVAYECSRRESRVLKSRAVISRLGRNQTKTFRQCALFQGSELDLSGHLGADFAFQLCSGKTRLQFDADKSMSASVLHNRFQLRPRGFGMIGRQFHPGSDHIELAASRSQAIERISTLIQRLKPIDRQIIVSYLEEMDANSIGEITGLSPANVAMKIHRIKNILKRWFGEANRGEGKTDDSKTGAENPGEGGLHAN